VLFVAVLENVIENEDVKVVPLDDINNFVLPFDHNNIVSRANIVINSYVLTDKDATKALVGETFRTTDMFNTLDTLHQVTGNGVAPDPSNLSRRLKGTEWFTRVSSVSETSLTTSSKGRPSTYWSFFLNNKTKKL
jgi:hypothetical protein